jgi:RNA polymerase sigma-70 factor (ECF subfamily)
MDFYAIYDQYYERVRKFILASVRDGWVADDLVQETFMRIQQNLESLRDSSKVSSWVFRIAINLCQDHFRSLKKQPFSECEVREQADALRETLIQKELEQGEMGQCVRDQIVLLPESLRTVIVLSDMMEFTHREIAEVLGITVENAKVRLHRARKRLKLILQEKCSFEVDERNVLICEPSNGQGF